MNNTVPLVLVALETGADADTLAVRFADAVELDTSGLRCVSTDMARQIVTDHRQAAAEQGRKIASRREAARQRPHPVRERVRALRAAQARWEHVTDMPALGVMRADDIESSMNASSRRMDEMLAGGEMVVHPVQVDR